MTEGIGRRATRVHLLLVAALGITGLGMLLVILLAGVGPDQFSRGIALFAAVLTAPLWLMGIAAAIDAVRTFRGRPVSPRRALAWALLATGGGVLLAYSFGHFSVLAALFGVSGGLALAWPAIAVVSSDGMSQYFYPTDPFFWIPIIGIVLGGASLVVQMTDRRRTRYVE